MASLSTLLSLNYLTYRAKKKHTVLPYFKHDWLKLSNALILLNFKEFQAILSGNIEVTRVASFACHRLKRWTPGIGLVSDFKLKITYRFNEVPLFKGKRQRRPIFSPTFQINSYKNWVHTLSLIWNMEVISDRWGRGGLITKKLTRSLVGLCSILMIPSHSLPFPSSPSPPFLPIWRRLTPPFVSPPKPYDPSRPHPPPKKNLWTPPSPLQAIHNDWLVIISRALTLYTLTSVCIFSILFSINFQRGWQVEFVSKSRAALVGDQIYSHNFMFDSGVKS